MASYPEGSRSSTKAEAWGPDKISPGMAHKVHMSYLPYSHEEPLTGSGGITLLPPLMVTGVQRDCFVSEGYAPIGPGYPPGYIKVIAHFDGLSDIVSYVCGRGGTVFADERYIDDESGFLRSLRDYTMHLLPIPASAELLSRNIIRIEI